MLDRSLCFLRVRKGPLQAFCLVGVDKLILQRRRTSIDNKDFHVLLLYSNLQGWRTRVHGCAAKHMDMEMVDRLLGIISGIDDDTIAAFGDFLDLSHLFYRVEQMPHELVRNDASPILAWCSFGMMSVWTGIIGEKVVKGDYHIVFVYDSRRDLPCGNFAKDAVSHNARTAFPDSVTPLEFRMTVYCQMSDRLRKSRVSGCIIGGSVKLAHENINFLLRRRKTLLQVGENCDSTLVSLQTVFELQGVAFEDRHGSVQIRPWPHEAYLLFSALLAHICIHR